MDQEQGKEDSVFDFLYVDKSRLSYLLAQLSDDGVLQVAKRLHNITGTNSGDLKAGVGSLGGSVAASDGFSESTDHQYDVSWLLPTNAITVLDEHRMIRRSLGNELGSIVLVKGTLEIYDLELVKRIWDGVVAMMFEKDSKKTPKERKQYSLAGKILKDMPPAMQFALTTSEGQVWSILDDSCLTMNQHALSLKHGSTVQGAWYVLGILDALPDNGPIPHTDSDRFISLLAPLGKTLKEFLGRPDDAFGVTPLMIFRPCIPALDDQETESPS